jgi:hypothetical protein
MGGPGPWRWGGLAEQLATATWEARWQLGARPDLRPPSRPGVRVAAAAARPPHARRTLPGLRPRPAGNLKPGSVAHWQQWHRGPLRLESLVSIAPLHWHLGHRDYAGSGQGCQWGHQ